MPPQPSPSPSRNAARPPGSRAWRVKPWLLRLYRLSVVVGVAGLLRWQVREVPAVAEAPPMVSVRAWFPEAAALGPVMPVRQAWPVLSAQGGELGKVLRTSPVTDDIVGYAGPSDLLIAEEPDGTVRGVSILRSGDTPDHMADVARDPGFAKAFQGWQPASQPVPKVDAVSGSTLTSLAMAEAVAARLGADPFSLRFPEPVTLEEVKSLFPEAAAWEGQEVRDGSGKRLGGVLRTSPASDAVRGHGGPTEMLIGLEPDGMTVRGVRLRKSYDTPDYVDQVKDDRFYLKWFAGRTLAQLAAMDFAKEGIEGVSGATETSYAVAEGLKRRAALAMAKPAEAKSFSLKSRDLLLILVLLGALMMAFTRLRGSPRVRLVWQATLIGYLGLVSHDLLSLGLLTGWAAHGPAWRTAPGLVLLGAAALLVPWAAGRQVYCHQICPHGAAQLWLGKLTKRKIVVPPPLGRWLERLPGALLLLGLAGAFALVPVVVADLEPFDAWAWRSAGVGVLGLAGLGLLASVFVPQAYCRYGCPTGALLKWVRTTGPGDHWTRRDTAALVFVVVAAVWVFAPRFLKPTGPNIEPEEPAAAPLQVSGRTMGTTWSLKVRASSLTDSACRAGVQAQLDLVENLLSTWREDTPVARFNHTASTAPQPLPDELLPLLRHGQTLAELTGGAYDLTIGPLVRAWGYGPPPRPSVPPGPDEIAGLRQRTGWEKLTLSQAGAAKAHPQLEIDLTSLAEGWALDRAAQWLRDQGVSDFLLEAGGELRSSGAWRVAIELPSGPLLLTSQSLSTSGTYRQSRTRAAGAESHLIDPRTGSPVRHRTITVSVLAADSLTADSWATALNVLGVEAGLPLADRLGLAARFVEEVAPGHLRIVRSAAWVAETRPLLSTHSLPHPARP